MNKEAYANGRFAGMSTDISDDTGLLGRFGITAIGDRHHIA